MELIVKYFFAGFIAGIILTAFQNQHYAVSIAFVVLFITLVKSHNSELS